MEGGPPNKIVPGNECSFLIPDRKKLAWDRVAAVLGEDPIGGNSYSMILVIRDRPWIKNWEAKNYVSRYKR